MNAPQIIWIVLSAVGLTLCIQRHGKPRDGRHNLNTDLIGMSLNFGLLYWGGFFSGGAA